MSHPHPGQSAAGLEAASQNVAVVIPVKNAAHLLRGCVASVRAQTRPPNMVVIAVAQSDDGTATVAQELSSGAVRVVDNRGGDRGTGINGALSCLSGADFVALVDAQARLEPDYLERALAALRRSGADVAGGPMRPFGRTTIGQALAAALQSTFGIGDSQFHFIGDAREADSVYLGVYRARVFDVVGRYNTKLLRTEDDDMNARIRAAGMRIWLDPTIRSTYLCRNSLAEIWRQYYGYGYWKVALAIVRPEALRRRHLVPAGFMLSVFAGLALLPVGSRALLVLLAAYGAVAVVAAAVAPVRSWRARLLFPIVTFVLHSAYGLGSLHGVLRWRTLQRRLRGGQADA